MGREEEVRGGADNNSTFKNAQFHINQLLDFSLNQYLVKKKKKTAIFQTHLYLTLTSFGSKQIRFTAMNPFLFGQGIRTE